MSRQVSRGSAGEYQSDSGRSRAAPVESIKQMSRQVWRDSAGEYQADERITRYECLFTKQKRYKGEHILSNLIT